MPSSSFINNGLFYFLNDFLVQLIVNGFDLKGLKFFPLKTKVSEGSMGTNTFKIYSCLTTQMILIKRSWCYQPQPHLQWKMVQRMNLADSIWKIHPNNSESQQLRIMMQNEKCQVLQSSSSWNHCVTAKMNLHCKSNLKRNSTI